MTIEHILIFAHIIGTIIGVGSATMLESHLGKALKDKLVSEDERAILGVDYRAMRVGLVIIILSGFGFLLLDKFEGKTMYLYSPYLWAKLTFVMVILANTLLLQAKSINLYWGSTFSFVSWWSAALVGMFVTHRLRFDFFGDGQFITVFASLMSLYVVAVIVGAIALNFFRNKSLSS
ncbi:MAG: hypothetical protein K9M10_00920 [Candidatus Pacebacteria bacterium]|nr:hypothetical protein [Candidatus Paceibacterota bacterium]MCF7857025.1 hypothetical protein [Candidatus Paceibacterota bacterium]